MTPIERYLAVCRGELPDRAPVSPFIMQFAASVAGVTYKDYCESGEVMATAAMREKSGTLSSCPMAGCASAATTVVWL